MSKTFIAAFAAASLSVGAAASAGAAQGGVTGCRQSLNSGLFTLPAGEGVNLHASFDDDSRSGPATVRLRLLDSRGTVVARDERVLMPGESTTLRFADAGAYRAQIQAVDTAPAASRRSVIGSLEFFRTTAAAGQAVPASMSLNYRSLIFFNANEPRTCGGPD